MEFQGDPFAVSRLTEQTLTLVLAETCEVKKCEFSLIYRQHKPRHTNSLLSSSSDLVLIFDRSK